MTPTAPQHRAEPARRAGPSRRPAALLAALPALLAAAVLAGCDAAEPVNAPPPAEQESSMSPSPPEPGTATLAEGTQSPLGEFTVGVMGISADEAALDLVSPDGTTTSVRGPVGHTEEVAGGTLTIEAITAEQHPYTVRVRFTED
ncbi:hypothetical protein [Allonocardiopsis opalescens]|uniref:Uncharacterized protein n=1 Tax=Allonocardiopsis opalescens TaxID=1144618 RepID=A0A2T0Q9Q9_9ACTN|nr:hypothetical protein [Allonocardiopsis opalescens]PRY00629.1 hypothetical protein CLV72_102260 [Allonocardiopsis opalescens]